MTYQPHQSEDATMVRICERHDAACVEVMKGMRCPACPEGAKPDPEWDRGEATQPVELYDEATWQEVDRLRNVDKGPTLARRDDQHAMDLQIQMQGAIGELPR